MAGKYEIYKDRGGKHRFRLKASNGQIILASQGYSAKTGCKNGVASVKKNGRYAKQFERCTSRNGKPYFLLKAKNGQVICKSEMYNTERAMENGIASVRKNAPGGAIVEV